MSEKKLAKLEKFKAQSKQKLILATERLTEYRTTIEKQQAEILSLQHQVAALQAELDKNGNRVKLTLSDTSSDEDIAEDSISAEGQTLAEDQTIAEDSIHTGDEIAGKDTAVSKMGASIGAKDARMKSNCDRLTKLLPLSKTMPKRTYARKMLRALKGLTPVATIGRIVKSFGNVESLTECITFGVIGELYDFIKRNDRMDAEEKKVWMFEMVDDFSHLLIGICNKIRVKEHDRLRFVFCKLSTFIVGMEDDHLDEKFSTECKIVVCRVHTQLAKAFQIIACSRVLVYDIMMNVYDSSNPQPALLHIHQIVSAWPNVLDVHTLLCHCVRLLLSQHPKDHTFTEIATLCNWNISSLSTLDAFESLLSSHFNPGCEPSFEALRTMELYIKHAPHYKSNLNLSHMAQFRVKAPNLPLSDQQNLLLNLGNESFPIQLEAALLLARCSTKFTLELRKWAAKVPNQYKAQLPNHFLRHLL